MSTTVRHEGGGVIVWGASLAAGIDELLHCATNEKLLSKQD